jgi:hypothetical protein
MVSCSEKDIIIKKDWFVFYVWLYHFSRSTSQVVGVKVCSPTLTELHTSHPPAPITDTCLQMKKCGGDHSEGRRYLQGRQVREGSVFILSPTWLQLVIIISVASVCACVFLVNYSHEDDTGSLQLNFKFGSMRPRYAGGKSRYHLLFVCVRVTSLWREDTEDL